MVIYHKCSPKIMVQKEKNYENTHTHTHECYWIPIVPTWASQAFIFEGPCQPDILCEVKTRGSNINLWRRCGGDGGCVYVCVCTHTKPRRVLLSAETRRRHHPRHVWRDPSIPPTVQVSRRTLVDDGATVASTSTVGLRPPRTLERPRGVAESVDKS